MESAQPTRDGRGQGFPPFLSVLAERFDPKVIDVPVPSARIRLVVEDGVEWDAAVSATGIRLTVSNGSRPDAILEADEGTWTRIARDMRGGSSCCAFRSLPWG